LAMLPTAEGGAEGMGDAERLEINELAWLAGTVVVLANELTWLLPMELPLEPMELPLEPLL